METRRPFARPSPTPPEVQDGIVDKASLDFATNVEDWEHVGGGAGRRAGQAVAGSSRVVWGAFASPSCLQGARVARAPPVRSSRCRRFNQSTGHCSARPKSEKSLESRHSSTEGKENATTRRS